jgi:inorganic pyrophosphatase
MENKIWSAIDRLVQTSEVIIDRPKGSTHPRFPSVVYPLDYGYLAGTRSSDRGGIDVWVGSDSEGEVIAIVCTVDLSKSDAEVKFLIGCTNQEIREILKFHNRGSQSALLISRHGA